MARIPKPFVVRQRPDTKTYSLTLNVECGLPGNICNNWYRKSFRHLPEELASYRNPKNKSMAEEATLKLIEFLRKKQEKDISFKIRTENITVGEWLKRNAKLELIQQKAFPFLIFHGTAEEAMKFYEVILPSAKIESIIRFEKGQRGDEGKVMNGILSFMGQKIMLMDMQADYDCPSFNWATSFYLECKSVKEFDAVFNGLAKGGVVMMKEEPFMQFRKVAWVTDKFGVTWQPVLV